MEKWNSKCRFFNENYACDTLASENLLSCGECKFLSNYDKKILIIKLGALGDVLRTTPILEAIKNKYPQSLIYWLVEDNYGEGRQLLEANPYVDKILILNLASILRIQQEDFDILYSLETSTPGTLIANLAKTKEKYGYFFNQGATSCYNKSAEEYLETAFLNHAKLANRKTYQQMIFQAAGFNFEGEEIIFNLSNQEKAKNNKNSKKVLGINFSSGLRWQSKSWGIENVREFVKKASNEYEIILLGGKEEKEKINSLADELRKETINVKMNNSENSILEFASIINSCDKIITTDSMALHLALSLKKPIIALFFSTPDWEIESYGRMKKLISPLLKQHFFSNKYSEALANSITADDVLKALQENI